MNYLFKIKGKMSHDQHHSAPLPPDVRARPPEQDQQLAGRPARVGDGKPITKILPNQTPTSTFIYFP